MTTRTIQMNMNRETALTYRICQQGSSLLKVLTGISENTSKLTGLRLLNENSSSQTSP